jgi:DNA replication regulator DPB11
LDSINAGERRPFQPYIQRAKKAKIELAPTLGVDIDLADGGRHGSIAIKNEFAKMEPQGSKEESRAAVVSELDKTTFQNDDTLTIKTEELPIIMDSTFSAAPLKEISPNSPRKPPLPKGATAAVLAVEPAVKLPPEPQETIGNAITSLLAKSKPSVAQAQDPSEQADGQEAVRKKRAPTRIFGRAASNVSAVSTFSRASSVDSTGSSGQAVARPRLKSLSGEQQRNSSSLPGSKAQPNHNILMLMNGLAEDGANSGPDDESQPSMTQMQYDDPESTEYKERVIARVTGSTIERKAKERAPTIASLGNLTKGGGGETPRARKTRTLRERMNGKGRV